MNNFKLKTRKVGSSTMLSVITRRGDITAQSSEKVLPPVVEYQGDSSYRLVSAKEIITSLKTHPYKPNSPDFSKERLDDLTIEMLFQQLEHFPTLPKDPLTKKPHPVAEFIYSHYVYLKPSAELAKSLKKLSFTKKAKVLAEILDKLVVNLKEDLGVNLDLISVPKRGVGTFAYVGDKNGMSIPAKTFAFGFENAIPRDRIARELSSFKACEKFLNPSPLPFEMPENLRPYVSMLRVAIVGVETSMLDSGDLYESGLPKIACDLCRVKNVKDITTVAKPDRNLVFHPFRAGIEVHHEKIERVDETVTKPGAIRLIFPGGVKIASQLQKNQAYDLKGNPVDMLLDFDTFAGKGAVACFAMQKENFGKGLTLEECKDIFEKLPLEKVVVGNTTYEGYILELPVIRPGQRYTEMSRPTSITVDLIAQAILAKEYKVPQVVEDEYRKLKNYRKGLMNEIKRVNN